MRKKSNKKNIYRKKRNIIIFIAIILFIATSVLLIYEVSFEKYVEENRVLYNYNISSNIDYEVFLKPNILYEEESLGEGNIYLREFIDYINMSFIYNYNGHVKVQNKGNYNIVAVVEGYVKDDERFTTIWSKEFLLLKDRVFFINGSNIYIDENLKLDIKKFNDFASKVIDDTKINCQTKLTIYMNVNLKANTEHGLVEESFSPNITIPLNKNYFSIDGELTKEKQGNIEEKFQVKVPYNKNLVTLYSIIMGILFIFIILFLILTKGIEPDIFETKLKKIFKKHGDRLVALNTAFTITNENINYVKSIDDLVRVSDEIGKPIMYKYSSNYKDITGFFVFDLDKVYVSEVEGQELEVGS